MIVALLCVSAIKLVEFLGKKIVILVLMYMCFHKRLQVSCEYCLK